MKKRIFVGISMAVLATSLVSIAPASAGSFCNNGSYSSNSGRGTCSYNGGVNKNYPSYSDPGSSSFKRNNGFGSSLSNSFGSNSNYSPSYGSSRNNGFGSSRNNGFGSTSSWGNSLSSNSYCTGLFC